MQLLQWLEICSRCPPYILLILCRVAAGKSLSQHAPWSDYQSITGLTHTHRLTLTPTGRDFTIVSLWTVRGNQSTQGWDLLNKTRKAGRIQTPKPSSCEATVLTANPPRHLVDTQFQLALPANQRQVFTVASVEFMTYNRLDAVNKSWILRAPQRPDLLPLLYLRETEQVYLINGFLRVKSKQNSSNLAWKGKGPAPSDCLTRRTPGCWITGNWHLTAHNHGILHVAFQWKDTDQQCGREEGKRRLVCLSDGFGLSHREHWLAFKKLLARACARVLNVDFQHENANTAEVNSILRNAAFERSTPYQQRLIDSTELQDDSL